ncbi:MULTISPECIES: DUF262 domain-containing protein [unclassified Streptomyces]|uniref:DUF262 domain-containing protein n=1 Tax=unclassified Streptomyces TaxID=2593676 RepID=UPI00324505DB
MLPQAPTHTKIHFDLKGIAEILKSSDLRVPIYQRSYCWHAEEEVSDFWADVKSAFEDNAEYFLGTVVLTAEGGSVRKMVIDGQQRLVTASLLIAAIRDEFHYRGEGKKSEGIQRRYLADEDLYSDGIEPKLSLNVDDDDVYQEIVLTSGHVAHDTRMEPIFRAYSYLRKRVHEVATAAGGSSADRLLKLVSFLENWARLGVVEVPTEADAYVIFESLNNRGADLTTADLLKNYLFGRAKDDIDKVRTSWAKATNSIDTTNASFIAFLRHYWSSVHGPTRERDLYKEIKRNLTSQRKVVEFSRSLAEAAALYAAISNSDNEIWDTHGAAGKADISLIAGFNLAPVKPLLMAAMKHFDPQELRKLTRHIVSWSVRGMIVGTINSRGTEDRYCSAAMKVRSGIITKAAKVQSELGQAIPSDNDFREAFAIARVSKNRDARYYLRALERGSQNTLYPELVPNEDEAKVNLEHVLPKNPNPSEWPGFDKQEISSWVLRLGNMVLLAAEENKRIGNKPFMDKRTVFSQSSLKLTKEAGDHQSWSSEVVAVRQGVLAELAVTVWPRGV